MTTVRALAGIDAAEGAVFTWAGADPQLLLVPENGGAWPAGWYAFELDCTVRSGILLAPQLFPDFGDGFADATRIDLEEPDADGRIRQVLLFSKEVKSLRFDPSIAPADVVGLAVQMRPLGRWGAFSSMLRRCSTGRGRRHALRVMLAVSAAIRRGGLSGIGSELQRRYREELRIARIDYGSWSKAAVTQEGDRRGEVISVVMPTWNTPIAFLDAAVASVVAQGFQDWELCIADDASTDVRVRQRLRELASSDPRIRVRFRESQGGIAAATNDALALARGAFVAFLDHDDVLASNALGRMSEALRRGGGDVAYSDHDYLSPDGRRCSPYFKPDWSPDLFLAQMYMGHLIVARRALVASVGGVRSDVDGSQDYDLMLRLVGAGATVVHVPEVLYHWRQHAGSTAGDPGSKPYAHDAGRRALQAYLDARSPGARADDGRWLFCYDVRYPVPSPAPLASIIIPTRDRLDLLEPCVRTLLSQTDYPAFEVVVVDNGSQDAETLAWLRDAPAADPRLRVIRADEPFNWSRLNNRGVKAARGDVLVFLNNDTEIIDGGWLRRLVEHSLRPEVATVGPLLLYPDRTIQHAGVVVGIGGWADHPFKGLPPEHHQDLFVSPMLRRNVLAVTGACMAIARDTFERLGGFDESFVVCGSDVELGLRAHRRGLWNVYVPEAALIHHESKTRDASKVPAGDFVRSDEAYGAFRHAGDPFFNPNLDWSRTTPALGSLVR
ncbi:MAG: glycosyltransferase family 2 protein [Silanimonas sp.]